jgi:hypothetical protein
MNNVMQLDLSLPMRSTGLSTTLKEVQIASKSLRSTSSMLTKNQLVLQLSLLSTTPLPLKLKRRNNKN